MGCGVSNSGLQSYLDFINKMNLLLVNCRTGHTFMKKVFPNLKLAKYGINTSYLTDSYISFTLKLESRQNVCSNRPVRSSKKIISDFPSCGKMVVFVTEFVIFLKTSK